MTDVSIENSVEDIGGRNVLLTFQFLVGWDLWTLAIAESIFANDSIFARALAWSYPWLALSTGSLVLCCVYRFFNLFPFADASNPDTPIASY